MSTRPPQNHSCESLLERWSAAPIGAQPQTWPRLFWTAEETESLRKRALAVDGLAERVRKAAEDVINDPTIFASEPAWHSHHHGAIITLAKAAWLTGEERLASLTTRLLDRAASAETWVAPVHLPMRCDHRSANVGATVARVLDMLAGKLTDDHLRRYREAVREKCLDPFLAAYRARNEFWAKRDCVSNWRIMTCGDAGLAALGTAFDAPDRDEILAYATEGVADILDTIPEDGDYVEGPHYFLTTLGMGLRFLVALKRLRPDAEAFLRHPRLAGVADYVAHVTEPDGQVFDYFDNGLSWSGDERATMLLIAAVHGRDDLIRTARDGEIESIEQIAWDDADEADKGYAGSTSAHFRRTGLVTCRSDWSDAAFYAAFRCGPNTFGHSHLDCGTFVISAGKARFVIDEGTWRYAHYLGFFDTGRRRWDFDATATVGHNTLLIDGRGQVYDDDAPGLIVHYAATEAGTVAVGDMTAAYGGRVSACVRTFVYLRPATVLLHDHVLAEEPCHVEWLLHHRGEVGGDEQTWDIVTGGKTLTVSRLMPEEDEAWRVSDVVRRTRYVDSNTGTPVTPEIRYRSCGPIAAKTEHDILMALALDGLPEPMTVTEDGDRIEIRLTGQRVVIDRGTRRADIADGRDLC